MQERFNLLGMRFGKLVVTAQEQSRNRQRYWRVKCDCGGEAIVMATNLRRGNSQSCGKCPLVKHGMARTKIHGVWLAMKQRCINPNDKAYPNYGGRGIKIDPTWNSFEVFYQEMGDPPHGGTLERIDNDGPYSKSNCRWASRKEQCNNKRTNNMITAFGRTQSLTAWADEFGMHARTLHNRIHRGGMSPESALKLPLSR
jgi:hypothetical protein